MARIRGLRQNFVISERMAESLGKKKSDLIALVKKCHNKRYEGNWTGGGSALYTLTGTVIHGKRKWKKGRDADGKPVLCRRGQSFRSVESYGVRARIDGKWYPGVTNGGDETIGGRRSEDDGGNVPTGRRHGSLWKRDDD